MHRLGSDKVGFRLFDEYMKPTSHATNNIVQFRAVRKHIPLERVLPRQGAACRLLLLPTIRTE
jgi:hypothetical protein